MKISNSVIWGTWIPLTMARTPRRYALFLLPLSFLLWNSAIEYVTHEKPEEPQVTEHTLLKTLCCGQNVLPQFKVYLCCWGECNYKGWNWNPKLRNFNKVPTAKIFAWILKQAALPVSVLELCIFANSSVIKIELVVTTS